MRVVALAVAAALVGCGGDADPVRDPVVAGPPPDAGTQRGHGVDRSTVRVPDADSTPPAAALEITGRVAVAVGEDPESGVPRVRVSVHERLTCRGPRGTFERRRQRYFPPPAIERVRAAPGAELPIRASRTRRLRPSAGRCGPGARLESTEIEVWGEATNGLGLETVTGHQRISVRPGA